MGGQNSSRCSSITTVRDSALNFFPDPIHEASNSCYDETQGEGRRYEIPSVPTGKSGLIWYRIQIFLYGV